MNNHQDSVSLRPLSRKEHLQLLAERRRRRQKHRRRRLRRLRFYKAIRNVRFWLRVAGCMLVALCIVFWAKFAFVYDIPSYANANVPVHVKAYVTVKPWWFGPPVFDIGNYAETSEDLSTLHNPDQYLLGNLGKYKPILVHPQIIWALREGS